MTVIAFPEPKPEPVPEPQKPRQPDIFETLMRSVIDLVGDKTVAEAYDEVKDMPLKGIIAQMFPEYMHEGEAG